MQRRRSRPLALLAGLGLLVGACGADDGGPDGAAGGRDRLRLGLVYDVGGLGDQGVNDAVLLAAAHAEDELGMSVQELEPDASGSDREALIRSLARDGVDVVLAVGNGSAAAAEDVADDHPDTRFVVLDDHAVTAPNITVVQLRDEEAAFLAGAAAALTSASHRVGFVGGPADGATRACEAGYRAGARHVDPDVRWDAAYVPALPDGSGPDLGAAAGVAATQLAAGTDVVYGVPRAVGEGVAAAVAARGGATAIGSIVDLHELAGPAAGVVLTSTVRHVDVVLVDVLDALAAGRLDPGLRRLGLAEGAVGYATTGGLLPADVLTRVEELRGQITGGQIQVPTVP